MCPNIVGYIKGWSKSSSPNYTGLLLSSSKVSCYNGYIHIYIYIYTYSK